MSFCELIKGEKKTYCSKTKFADKHSAECQINPKTQRCTRRSTKKKVLSKKASKEKPQKLKGFDALKCSNDEDPISLSDLKTEVSVDDVIALPFKHGKTLCFEGDTIWSMFSNHVNHKFTAYENASKGQFKDVSRIDMSVWGVQEDLLKIKVATDFLTKRAKIGLKNKEFRNPNDPFVASGTPRMMLNKFLEERIDLHNDIHIEHLVKAILEEHSEPKKNIQHNEWKSIIEIIYGSWIQPPSNNITYLKPLTTTARSAVVFETRTEERRSIFVKLLISMYNEILRVTKSPDDSRSKLTHLLWTLQLSIQED